MGFFERKQMRSFWQHLPANISFSKVENRVFQILSGGVRQNDLYGASQRSEVNRSRIFGGVVPDPRLELGGTSEFETLPGP